MYQKLLNYSKSLIFITIVIDLDNKTNINMLVSLIEHAAALITDLKTDIQVDKNSLTDK